MPRVIIGTAIRSAPNTLATLAMINKAKKAGGGPWLNRSVAWLASTGNTSAPMRPRNTPKSMPVIAMSTTPTSHNSPPSRAARAYIPGNPNSASMLPTTPTTLSKMFKGFVAAAKSVESGNTTPLTTADTIESGRSGGRLEVVQHKHWRTLWRESIPEVRGEQVVARAAVVDLLNGFRQLLARHHADGVPIRCLVLPCDAVTLMHASSARGEAISDAEEFVRRECLSAYDVHHFVCRSGGRADRTHTERGEAQRRHYGTHENAHGFINPPGKWFGSTIRSIASTT